MFGLIVLDSVIKASKKYYSQTLFKSANVKQKRVKWRILSMMN